MRMERLAACRETEDFIGHVLTHPNVARAHSDDQMGMSFVCTLISGFRNGDSIFYFGFDGNRPVGFIFVNGFSDGWMFGGQYFLPGYNWSFAEKAIAKSMEMVHVDFPECKGVFAMIAKYNTLSSRVATRAGFTYMNDLPTRAFKDGVLQASSLYHFDLQGIDDE